MSFDSSRFTFNPWNDFSGVVMQQGRVQLDSDWNEWLAELTRRIRAGTLDTLGQAVYPQTTPNAFFIQPATDPAGNATISIGVGRMYVDGLLAENHGLPAPQSGGWIPPAVTASPNQPAWDPALDELVGQSAILYTQQPYYPNVAVVAPLPTEGGPYLFYLDVWQREVTFLEDPDLIEKAVAVDTTGRMQTVWQVKWFQVGANDTCSTLANSASWHLAPSAGRLTTGVVQSTPAGVCCLTPNTGYTGMENQLYRVEIHVPGNASSNPPATFKWSRDNASLATPVTAINGKVMTVQSTGKDNVLKFADWVEITDDWLELNGLPGELHEIDIVDNTAQTITLKTAVTGPFNPNDPTRHTRAICWNGAGITLPAPGTAVNLENGVTVSFDLDSSSGTQFNTGDFWSFAARAVDGTVENLVKAPPTGIHHHYARLAVATTLPLSASNLPSDCRVEWPPSVSSGGGCCTVVVKVGDDVQKAIDSLPDTGGCVCLKAGLHQLQQTLSIARKKNIMFHGESIGAVVQGPEQRDVLTIVDSQEITIENISFQSLNFLPRAVAIEIQDNVQRLAIRHCAIIGKGTGLGVRIDPKGNDEIEISDCAISGVSQGIMVNEGTNLALLRNQITGVLIQQVLSAGVIGIEINADTRGPVTIVGNVINGFAWGILQLSGPGSFIVGNSILRRGVLQMSPSPINFTGPLGQVIQTKAFAIVCQQACAVENNTIESTQAWNGGILAYGSNITAEQNAITSNFTPQDNTWNGLPIGIVVYQPEGSSAAHACVLRNSLTGPQNGIAALAESSDVLEFTQISDNTIEPGSSLAGNFDMTTLVALSNIEQALGQLDNVPTGGNPPATFGILLLNCDGARVDGNDLSQFSAGIGGIGAALITGIQQAFSALIEANQVSGCAIGILADLLTDTAISENELRNNGYSVALDTTSGALVESNRSSGANVVAHCFETMGTDVQIRGNVLSGGASGVLSSFSSDISIAENKVDGTAATGILVYSTGMSPGKQGSSATEANVLGNRVSNCGATAQSALEANLVQPPVHTPGTNLTWNFGTLASVGIALIECTGAQTVERCHVLHTGQVPKGQCADILILNGAHARVRDCRVDRGSDTGVATTNAGIYVYPTADASDANNCGADISGNYLNMSPALNSQDRLLLAIDAEIITLPSEGLQSDILFNGNMVLQKTLGSVAVKLQADSLAVTGNRIRCRTRGDFSLSIKYVSGLSYVGNVLSSGQSINGVISHSKGSELPTPAQDFNVNA